MAREPIRVLIVDDTPRDLEQLEGWLRGALSPTLETEGANRLSAALRRLEAGGIDLVLLDLFLPESKGLKTVRKLRRRVGDVPVIALTRFDDERTGVEAMREGAQDYLVKGEIDGGLLIRSIRHAIERHASERALRDSEQTHRVLAEKLRQANLELQSFSYSVSHDLRAPLRAITGFSEILESRHRASLDSQGQHYLDNIVQAGRQMGWLIDDLLAYSRLGASSLQVARISLGELLSKVIAQLAAQIEESAGRVDLPRELPSIRSSPTLLSQIFSNLIANALIFRRAGVPPRVTVRCDQGPESVDVHVADNGIGIPEEYREKIFDPFRRLHSQDEYAGTGIGLAIVKKAATLLGGCVSLESKVGDGTTFSVRLPRALQAIETWRS